MTTTATAPAAARERRTTLRLRWAVLGLAALAAAARLLQVRSPLSADAAGFLTVAGQWGPGTSLYGDLWVDRPPGLVLVFELADVLGGATALRVVGAVAAAASVVAAAWLGRLLTGRRAPALAAAVVVAALVSSRFLQVDETNGEVLALPWVLLGLGALAVAVRRVTGPKYVHKSSDGAGAPATAGVGAGRRDLCTSFGHAWAWAAVAGAAGVAAASMKQNFLDVFVAGGVVVVALLLRRAVRAARVLVGGALLGAGVTTALLLGLAWLRGTDPAALWDALVAFRLQAGEVISAHASPATGERAARLVWVWVATGLPLVLLGLARLRWVRRRPAGPDPLWSWVVLAVLGWEASGVLLGGSYWWHYLVGLVPSAALLVALAWPGRESGRTLRQGAVGVVAVVVASALATQVWTVVSPPREDASIVDVTTYLRDHAAPGDTGVVAYGQPQLLRDAGLDPAYEYLWSLPARVRDPELRELGRVLDGPDRPDWLVVGGRSLQTWGVDPEAARELGREVSRHYDVVHRNERLTVLHVTG